MPATKTAITLLASAAANPGSSKAAPARESAAIDCRGFYGGVLTYAISNGGSAPSVAVSLTFQISVDGQTWRDIRTVGGDTASGSSYTYYLDLPRAAMYVRVIAYGNATNAVTVAVELHAITAL